jgi:hypothetical protein
VERKNGASIFVGGPGKLRYGDELIFKNVDPARYDNIDE